jgi:gliding motility-associated lipoprotein GldH
MLKNLIRLHMVGTTRIYRYTWALALLILMGCQKIDLFEKNVSIPGHAWQNKFRPTIEFTIEDTTTLYHLFVVVRHTDAFGFNNLWMNIYTQSPTDAKPKKQQLDLTLAQNEKGWLGTGMNDIFEHRIRITREPIALQKGVYKFQLEQIMREDPLKEVLNVGLRVERVRP